MEIINYALLLAIAILALFVFVAELANGHTYRYELFLRIFLGMIVASSLGIFFYDKLIFKVLLNLSTVIWLGHKLVLKK